MEDLYVFGLNKDRGHMNDEWVVGGGGGDIWSVLPHSVQEL